MKEAIVKIEEDPETGDLLLPIPEEMLKELGWTENDLLEIEPSGKGFIIKKLS